MQLVLAVFVVLAASVQAAKNNDETAKAAVTIGSNKSKSFHSKFQTTCEPNCFDNNMCCKWFAPRGGCEDPAIQQLCQLSCGNCDGEARPVTICEDFYDTCALHASQGKCDPNPWMLENCRYSCNSCVSDEYLLETCPYSGGLKLVDPWYKGYHTNTAEALVDSGTRVSS
ncbi:unnamed protein product [Bursaphelenchus xylophilus]|uniref:(pine wood nematode) hypothetical protein n=1 Tax=Bursaphelenchus xylophilus TaxID=6326 RepID=A0A1I7RMJ3_BURXY|nr:unnamed protein product [Bursaphelenchus xylophilus]CAG9118550.1 unnamed protein product [Bursaphelenchus xylophilus]